MLSGRVSDLCFKQNALNMFIETLRGKHTPNHPFKKWYILEPVEYIHLSSSSIVMPLASVMRPSAISIRIFVILAISIVACGRLQQLYTKIITFKSSVVTHVHLLTNVFNDFTK